MNVEICFYSELTLFGKVYSNFSNMRTEFAWMTALNASHCPLHSIIGLKETSIKYDLGIVIIPKNISNLVDTDIVNQVRKQCKKVAFMQEGPSWYFQELPVNQSLWFFSVMQACDFCLAHNTVDCEYYEGLLNIPCFINPTLIVDSPIKDLAVKTKSQRQHIILGGNLGRWYGGFDSLVTSLQALNKTSSVEQIWAPSMGRMTREELNVEGLHHLPYRDWKNWMGDLNNFKYAVHLNPNSIGGTFSLNCAYLGIPCISNIDTNTQRLCFPDLSVRSNDIKTSVHLLTQLIQNEQFYDDCVKKAYHLYHEYFSLEVYLRTWQEIIQKVF